ncbi:MAG: fold metallo-hydrolase [Solirubrobacterales bacterium]|nr:fold metallo-hydrolase [Solirubrobacterales bacterium]
MQVLAIHPEVVVAKSVKWQTTCTLVHHGDETFLIDSPLYAEELESLPTLLQQMGWGLSGLLATHGDFDHVLGRLAFPDAALGVSETTAARLKAEMGDAARRLRDFDMDDYVQRQRPLRLGDVQALPVPGKLDIGDSALELLPADGHTHDGMSIWIPWAKVLVPGDYLSPVELPWLQEQGSREGYLATLGRLKPYVEQAEWVVSGHGGPIDGARALAIMREDVAYLQALGEGEEAAEKALPIARRDRRMLEIHADNLRRVAGGKGGS